EAPNDASEALDEDDDALEGTRTGVINHVVTSEDSIKGSPTEVLGNLLTDSTKSFPELRGRILEIVEGPGAGQERLILSNTATTLTLSSKFRETPTAASKYQIRFYHELAVPSVLVEVHDNDAAGVIVTEID